MTRFGLVVFVLGLWCGCGDDDESSPRDAGATPDAQADAGADAGEGITRLAVVADIAEHVLLPAYQDFASSTEALESATAAWAQSGDDADREAAQEAWEQAMSIWQRAELMQVGPAAAMHLATGGEDLRDEIYSWPLVNRCRVDQEIASGDYENVDAFASEVISTRGLDVMEVLLFITTEDNGCAPSSSLNTGGEWAAIVDELPSRRARYASTVATLLRRSAEGLVAAWESAFLEEMRTAGEGSSTYESAQEALNEISNALFYLDKETKDMKLATPAAISAVCMAESCPEDRESLYANRSLQHIVANLHGFRAVFTGGEHLGFDDLLADAGSETLANDIVDATDAAIETVESVEGDIPTVLAADAAGLDASHLAIKTVTDLLKTQFITVLDLELPMRAEGDND